MFGQSLLLPCDHKALHLFLERVNIKCLFCPRWLSLFGGLEGSTVDPNVIRWWRGPWCNKWVLKRSNLGYVGLIGLLWGTLAGPRQNRRPTRVVNGLVSHRSAHKGPYTNPVTIRVVIGLLLGPPQRFDIGATCLVTYPARRSLSSPSLERAIWAWISRGSGIQADFGLRKAQWAYNIITPN